MAVRLIESLATTDAMQQVFSDESVLRAMLDGEVALSHAEAKFGIIPQSAAKAIAEAADIKRFDTGALAKATLRAGTAGIPLVKALTERARLIDANAAGFVHWGATSQDVCDTALVLLLKQAQTILESDLSIIDQALERLSREHTHTVMLGRTLMQAAPPVTFGLKVAGWLAAVRRVPDARASRLCGGCGVAVWRRSRNFGCVGRSGNRRGQDFVGRFGYCVPRRALAHAPRPSRKSGMRIGSADGDSGENRSRY